MTDDEKWEVFRKELDFLSSKVPSLPTTNVSAETLRCMEMSCLDIIRFITDIRDQQINGREEPCF